MRTFDWLVFVFVVALGWVVPPPVTTRQKVGAAVCFAALVLMLVCLVRPRWLP